MSCSGLVKIGVPAAAVVGGIYLNSKRETYRKFLPVEKRVFMGCLAIEQLMEKVFQTLKKLAHEEQVNEKSKKFFSCAEWYIWRGLQETNPTIKHPTIERARHVQERHKKETGRDIKIIKTVPRENPDYLTPDPENPVDLSSCQCTYSGFLRSLKKVKNFCETSKNFNTGGWTGHVKAFFTGLPIANFIESIPGELVLMHHQCKGMAAENWNDELHKVYQVLLDSVDGPGTYERMYPKEKMGEDLSPDTKVEQVNLKATTIKKDGSGVSDQL